MWAFLLRVRSQAFQLANTTLETVLVRWNHTKMTSYWFGVSPNTVREISSQKETGHSGRHLGLQEAQVRDRDRRIKELRVLTDADPGVPRLPVMGRQGARADPGGYMGHFRGSTVPW